MIRLGILGTGIISECHFFALDKMKDVEIAAIASMNEKEGRDICARYQAHYYRDYHQLLNQEKNLDGIIIALPNYMHYQCIVDAVEAGISHIFCEKPMCTRLEDSEKLVELVKRNGVVLQIGYMKRFNPGFRKIKESLENLGEIECVNFNIFMSAPEPAQFRAETVSGQELEKVDLLQAQGDNCETDMGGAWYGDIQRSGGGAMTHNGSHHLDLLRYLFGDVVSLTCKTRNEKMGGEYFYNAVLTMEDNLDINMRVGRVDVPKLGPEWNIFDGGWNESVEVIGTRGYIRADNPTWQGYAPMKVIRWMQGMCGPETLYYECNEQWTEELSAFVRSCKNDSLEKECSSVIDGYRVDLLISEMRSSGKENGIKRVPLYKY